MSYEFEYLFSFLTESLAILARLKHEKNSFESAGLKCFLDVFKSEMHYLIVELISLVP